jgi:hypothetical protein
LTFLAFCGSVQACVHAFVSLLLSLLARTRARYLSPLMMEIAMHLFEMINADMELPKDALRLQAWSNECVQLHVRLDHLPCIVIVYCINIGLERFCFDCYLVCALLFPSQMACTIYTDEIGTLPVRAAIAFSGLNAAHAATLCCQIETALQESNTHGGNPGALDHHLHVLARLIVGRAFRFIEPTDMAELVDAADVLGWPENQEYYLPRVDDSGDDYGVTSVASTQDLNDSWRRTLHFLRARQLFVGSGQLVVAGSGRAGQFAAQELVMFAYRTNTHAHGSFIKIVGVCRVTKIKPADRPGYIFFRAGIDVECQSIGLELLFTVRMLAWRDACVSTEVTRYMTQIEPDLAELGRLEAGGFGVISADHDAAVQHLQFLASFPHDPSPKSIKFLLLEHAARLVPKNVNDFVEDAPGIAQTRRASKRVRFNYCVFCCFQYQCLTLDFCWYL